MARKIKNPVVVTISRAMAERLHTVLARRTFRLDGIVADALDDQVGRSIVVELTRKDALEMHRLALQEIQMESGLLTDRAYSRIEKAFRDAYDARLRASVGE